MIILMINDHIRFGGGGDAVFRLERQAYENAGHEVFTFSQSPEIPKNASERDIVCREFKGRFSAKLGKFVCAPHVYRSLKRLLEKIKPDLVRVHLLSKYPAAVYSALEDYPVIQTLHGPNLFCATSWGNLKNDSSDCEMGIGVKCWTRGCISATGMLLYTFLDYRTQPWIKKVVKLFHCPSKQIEIKAKALGYHPTIHIPLGIDFNFMKTEPATHDGPPTILYVGALVEEKGLLILPDALRLVKQHIPNVKLILCGRGILKKRLIYEFSIRNLTENVEFKGFVDHGKIIDQFRSVQVFVLPSIWAEQFGLVGPEAMACGVPCVASNVGGISEWLKDGEWGFLVPPRDTQALAYKIIKLLRDRTLRLRFGEAGRAYSRNVYNPEIYQQRWLELASSYMIQHGIAQK